ncbi:MAG: hypothetical protein CMO16_02975 [Thaumarchaeota archaeon]|nr:hypothetical protein [Nitrososphaerota archaeon]
MTRTIHKERGYKSLMTAVAIRRKQLGISQTELDRIVGCADGYVSKCECGVRTPSVFMYWCFVEALDAEIEIVAKKNE